MAKSGATSYRKTIYGILPRKEIIRYEVEGTKKGLIFLQTKAKVHVPLSSELIQQTHKVGFADILPDDAGTFRTIQVTYSSKEAPFYSKVAELMNILCADIEYALSHLSVTEHEGYLKSVIEILARFQHRFVFIHPFIDYNGRTARMFTNYILMSLELPIIEISAHAEKERKKYISALQKADIGDYEQLENLIAQSLNESLQSIMK